jgi:hypothetical protein
MLLPRAPRRPNERRKLTFRLDEKPGDPHERRKLTFRLDEKPGDPHRRAGPAVRIVEALTDAPSRTTAISNRYLALNTIPACHLASGVHILRTAVPTSMAKTRASNQALPTITRSPASKA